MSLIADLKDIRITHYAAYALAFAATVGPGVLTIFLYRPELIQNLDVIKLLVLSSSITIPISFFNSLVVMAFLDQKEGEDCSEVSFAASAIITSIFLYGVLYFSYLSEIQFKTFTICVAGLEVLFLVVIGSLIRLSERKKA